MKRNNLLGPVTFMAGLSLLTLVFGCKESTSPLKPGRPNILFIMADDHTTQAISCYEGIFADYANTVNIDKLADQGMMFTNAYCTNSICSPSRATIMTGKYSHKNGVYCLDEPLDTTQALLSKVLQDNGYNTAVFGKWHLKSTPHGFDEYKVLKRQGRYHDPEFIEKGVDSMVTREGWSTDIIADLTMDYIKNRESNEKPFFVMCQFKATHDPWATRPPYDTLFQNIDLPEPGNLLDDYENRSAAKRTTLKLEYIPQSTYPHDEPDSLAERDDKRKHIYQQYIKSFLTCGMPLDENIGRLMDFLDQEGLSENTVVVYTADQGHFLGEHGFFSKRFIYDESMRMPLIIRYPKVIKAGSKNDDMVINADFAPTLLDLAGVNIPSEMQGSSVQDLVAGNTPASWRNSVYYRYWQHIWHRDVTAHYGIRTKTHKLIYFYGRALGHTNEAPTTPEWELYDLVQDPKEMHNVYDEEGNKELIAELKRELLELKEKYDDPDSDYPEMEELNQTYFYK